MKFRVAWVFWFSRSSFSGKYWLVILQLLSVLGRILWCWRLRWEITRNLNLWVSYLVSNRVSGSTSHPMRSFWLVCLQCTCSFLFSNDAFRGLWYFIWPATFELSSTRLRCLSWSCVFFLVYSILSVTSVCVVSCCSKAIYNGSLLGGCLLR